MQDSILVAKGATDSSLLLRMANRHGLIAGATGTGKTVTLQKLAEGFSRAGTPVFLADVKGDLSGLSKAGGQNPKILERVQRLGLDDLVFTGYPTAFWDVFGAQGHPVRSTISEMGPLLLARLLNLNEVQAGVLSIVFKVADDQGLLLLDLKDFRAMLQYVADNAADFKTEYGNVSAASVGAIQRGLLTLEEQGGETFFGEPALDLDDLMQTDAEGRGVINILAADRLLQSPKVYTTFLLWLLSELFERLPEAGDLEAPKLVFFFDEAHLLFNDAPKALLDKIEQVVRLIRSKGVGVYFVTQNPMDVPDSVLGQLGNRVQHALRAYTPKDQKAVRAAAETFRVNPELNVEQAITELGVGEALVSFLDSHGVPSIVQRGLICPPGSFIGPIDPPERARMIRASAIFGHYEKVIDRESAYERLKAKAEAAAPPAQAPVKTSPPVNPGGGTTPTYSAPRGRPRETMAEAMMKSVVRAAGSQMGRSLIRGVLGSILGGRR
ncbi:MAG TPA: helicase HerA-like domain-containing protein [Terriglobia bacterium]|nr:helicase HerA-like domain-containing protein [Terriglobia bacterium]